MVKKQRNIGAMDDHEKYSSCTYASRYMTEPIPKFELPERSVSERTVWMEDRCRILRLSVQHGWSRKAMS